MRAESIKLLARLYLDELSRAGADILDKDLYSHRIARARVRADRKDAERTAQEIPRLAQARGFGIALLNQTLPPEPPPPS